MFGPVYAPLSKGGYARPRGIAALRAACRAVGTAAGAPMPVFALGGITAERARRLGGRGIAATGPAGIAVIGAVMGAESPGEAVTSLLAAIAGDLTARS